MVEREDAALSKLLGHDFPPPRATMGKVVVYFALTLLQPLA